MMKACMTVSSVMKKYLMALSGFVLAGFVFVHMAGNLQMFMSAELMNEYAHLLQHLPYNLLWVFRIVLLTAVVVHVWMALSLTMENRRARPEDYMVKKRVQASLASKTMGVSGSILLIFIVFHIFHFTVRSIYPEYQTFKVMLGGEEVNDVYRMVITGFSHDWVTVFYVVSMGLLCMHLSHGVSSMFQSIGWRNSGWRGCLDKFAKLYGWIVFLGFVSVPVCVMVSKYTSMKIFPV